MSVAVKPIFKDRPFFVSPYHKSDQDRLRPKNPVFCTKNQTNNQACRITAKGLRHRKCGPAFPLLIYECSEHSISFTIYPPGWQPYGRKPLLNLAPDGSIFNDNKNTQDTLRGTVFSAALDAAECKRWLDEARSDSYDKGVFKTQKRYIYGLLKLFGITPASTERHRECVTAKLGIALSHLSCSYSRIRDGPIRSWRKNGLEIKRLADQLQHIFRHLASIQILGFAVEFWGLPMDYQ